MRSPSCTASIVDRVVAEFIGYGSVRPNYAALIEIPLRLKEHAAAKREAALKPQAELAEIERQAMLPAGVDAKEKVLAEARHKLAVIDDTVEKKRDMLRKVDEARVALATGNSDPTYNEALTTIASADAADSLANLYAEARRTPTSADEAIVGRLEGIDPRITETETEIAGLRREAIELSRRRGARTVPPDRLRSSTKYLQQQRRYRRCAQGHAGRGRPQWRPMAPAAAGPPITAHSR